MPHTLNDAPRSSHVGSRTYTNADLKRRPRVFPGPDIPFPEGTDVRYLDPESPIQDDRPQIERSLQQAREALQRAARLSEETGSADLFPPEQSIVGMRLPGPSILEKANTLGNAARERLEPSLVEQYLSDFKAQSLPDFRGVTSGSFTPDIAEVQGRADLLDQPELPLTARALGREFTSLLGRTGEAAQGLGSIPYNPLGPGLRVAGGALQAPDVARRLITPDEDESRLGAAGQGLAAALIGLTGVAEAPRLTAPKGRAPYGVGFRARGITGADGPPPPAPPASASRADVIGSARDQLKTSRLAKQIAEESGQSIEDVLQASRRAIPGGNQARQAIMRIIESMNPKKAASAFDQPRQPIIPGFGQ